MTKKELIYTGGGIYIAQYEEDGFYWTVTNEYSGCLSKFRIPADRDEMYMEEDMVWSVGADELPSKKDEEIYRKLYKMLEDEGCLLN